MIDVSKSYDLKPAEAEKIINKRVIGIRATETALILTFEDNSVLDCNGTYDSDLMINYYETPRPAK
jgi:hypothetical protein